MTYVTEMNGILHVTAAGDGLYKHRESVRQETHFHLMQVASPTTILRSQWYAALPIERRTHTPLDMGAPGQACTTRTMYSRNRRNRQKV